MSAEAKPEKIDVKKMLGNPKITFVVGGPGSGKGTQCAKLVEEFGYTHISTGDLMRVEMKTGSREGDRIRKIVTEGGLVPFELTVQVLINALIANPSQNYLIDGFPRAVDQATHFEQNVCEAQNVLYFDCTEETCVKRLLKRGETSGRVDDNEETITKRFNAFKDQTIPVVDLYERFGKVRRVDANRDELEVYEDTRKAMLPQISCIIGPKASGKTTLGNALCERTNMKMINFNDFISENCLTDENDETVTVALIKQMSKELAPRVLLEDFPQTEFQAKFFLKNCVTPSRVFSLKCSKDICQERMICLQQSDPNYQASTILSKRIRIYNENSALLMPYLEANTNLRVVDTEQIFKTAQEQLCSHVEPQIIHVRSGGSDKAPQTRKDIMSALIQDHGFFELDTNALIRDENERRTEIGIEVLSRVSAGKVISAELIVKMLKKIIYSGVEKDKFILTGFPDTNEQAIEFEQKCAKITAIIYASGNEPVVEIMSNNLEMFSIDALFQKQFRLKTMKCWDETTFKEQLGQKTDWSILCGRKFSGIDMLGGLVSKLTGGKVISMEKIDDEITKKRLMPEDQEEPVEGSSPVAEVEKDVLACIAADKANGCSYTYLFDGYRHDTAEAFIEFASSNLGAPNSVIIANCDQNEVNNRYKKENEVEELDEGAQETLKAQADEFEAQKASLVGCLDQFQGKCEVLNFQTDQSQESLTSAVRASFCAKVILVNHESRLSVDTACANLAIKYNMIYLSVYQLIKKEIETNTPMGQALAASKKLKCVNLDTTKDEFDEAKYSAVHFASPLVMEIVQNTIAANRTNQKFILLEGLVNSNKLESPEERLELRYMDEFFAIEKNIGEVFSVVSLQFKQEPTQFIDDKFEEFKVEEVKEEVKEPVEGEEPEEQPPEEVAEGEDGEGKKEVFDPSKFKWTITNGRPKNLPQLFRDYKGINCHPEERNAETFSSTSQKEAVVKALDEFCQRMTEDGNTRNIYQQVIFVQNP